MPSKFARKSLITLVSDEGIQGNPRKSKPAFGGETSPKELPSSFSEWLHAVASRAEVMRTLLAGLLLLVALPPAHAVVRLDEPNACSDRNELQNVAYDARPTVIQFYFKGFVQAIQDKDKQACLEEKVLADEAFAVINKARLLIEKNCMSVDAAAQTAAKEVCP